MEVVEMVLRNDSTLLFLSIAKAVEAIALIKKVGEHLFLLPVWMKQRRDSIRIYSSSVQKYV
jgi:hypothetical protein